VAGRTHRVHGDADESSRRSAYQRHDHAGLCRQGGRERPAHITTDPELERAFASTIPVVELRGARLELAVSPARLRRFLEAHLDAVRA
jgi:hypothetical protein